MHRSTRLALASLFALGGCASQNDLPGPSVTGFEPRTAAHTADLGLVPFDVSTQDPLGPDDHYAMYGKLPEIVVSPSTAGLDVALQSYTDPDHPRTFVLRYAGSADARTLAAAYEAPTLGVLLGFVSAPDGGFYYATGTTDDAVSPTYPAVGVHRANVVRVYRADAHGQILLDVDLDLARAGVDADAAPIVDPGTASSARLALAGNQLALVHGIHTEYDANVMARHQRAMSTYLDATTGEITSTGGIWVSHSFDQRYLADGTDLFELHLGDAYPRAVVASRVRGGTAGDAFPLFHPKGTTGNNNTFARLGGIARIDAGAGAGAYVVLFATEHGTETAERVNGARDLAIVRAVADFADGEPSAAIDGSLGTTFEVTSGSDAATNRVLWLTDYAGDTSATHHAERPHLVALGGGELLVLWERWTTGTEQTFDGTFAMRIDGAGTVLAAATRVSDVHLPRGDDAFLDAGRACWVTGAAATGVLTEHCVSPALAATDAPLP